MSGRIYKKHVNRKRKSARYKKYFFGPPDCPEMRAFTNANQSGFFYWETDRSISQYRVARREADFELIEGLDYWEIQEIDHKYKELYRIKNIGTSRWHGGGKTRYKDVYTRYRRLEARKLEYCALIEDEIGFEKIAPDGWRGSIGWLIW